MREDRKPKEKESVFLDLVIWGKRAEGLGPHLTKGKSLLVNGRLEIKTRKAETKTFVDTRVVVNEVEFLGKKIPVEGEVTG